MKKCIVCFSGGLDSTTCLAIAADQGYECYALSFDYGQRHRAEIEAAKKIIKSYQVREHKVIQLPTAYLTGSALTDQEIDVPVNALGDEIPVTYVPARNTIFLSMALGWAEVLGAEAIYMGASAIDYSNYPDCRPEYFDAFQAMADLATKSAAEGLPVKIITPLIDLSKADTIKLGIGLGVSYQDTVSCYQADERGYACGSCDSCLLRIKGFREAGVNDPTLYKVDINQ